MNEYKCTSCGALSYSSAELDHLINKTCPECGGDLAPARDSGRKIWVQIGTSTYEVDEADEIEQVRQNYQKSGFTHALRFYWHLRPDICFQEAYSNVLAWCGNMKEGSVLYVSG